MEIAARPVERIAIAVLPRSRLPTSSKEMTHAIAAKPRGSGLPARSEDLVATRLQPESL